jgi:hypothetical protein
MWQQSSELWPRLITGYLLGQGSLCYSPWLRISPLKVIPHGNTPKAHSIIYSPLFSALMAEKREPQLLAGNFRCRWQIAQWSKAKFRGSLCLCYGYVKDTNSAIGGPAHSDIQVPV